MRAKEMKMVTAGDFLKNHRRKEYKMMYVCIHILHNVFPLFVMVELYIRCVFSRQ